jgi:DNA-binding CsgD family transcriptional regulator
MPRARKLNAEQHRTVAERSLLYLRYRIEAAKHSPYQLAKELGVHVKTVRAYLDRKAV